MNLIGVGVIKEKKTEVLILASNSSVRATLLKNAGISFKIVPSEINEDPIKIAMRPEGSEAASKTLALEKAKVVSHHNKEALVIGADQLLDCGGVWLDKPKNRDDALKQLKILRGKAHFLATSVCVIKNGSCLWSFTASPRLKMRLFTEDLLNTYLTLVEEDIFGSVGSYRLEGVGVQLFESIEGDYFSILGLPLLPLLEFLRTRGILEE